MTKKTQALGFRLSEFMALWIHGFMDSWLYGFMALWKHSSKNHWRLQWHARRGFFKSQKVTFASTLKENHEF